MDLQDKSIATWNKVAQLYQDKFMNLDLYDNTYDLFCSLVKKPGAHVFEIGCGPGNMTRYLLRKRPDFNMQAIDSAAAMIQLAEANNPGARFSVMDARKISEVTTRFEGIVCGFCLPYLSKEESAQLISDCASLLHTGGILYLSCIEGDYIRSGYETGSTGDSLYVYYHQADYLQEYLNINGFELLSLERKCYKRSETEDSVHAIFIARKK